MTVRVRHVGGNHSAESSVMYIEPDRVLFLGDCMYESLAGVLTAELAFPLHDAILGFDAELFVDGHIESILSRRDIEGVIEKMRLAEKPSERDQRSPCPTRTPSTSLGPSGQGARRRRK